MTVRLYQSSDTNAPALRGNTPGDLINLLEKCLVTGYGVKAGAGWTKPFAGTNVAVFKQGVGSNGMYLRIDDTSTATTQRAARVVGYEMMSGVNDGTPSPFPTDTQFSGGLYWFTQSTGSVANPRPWKVLADEMFFYFMLGTRGTDSEAATSYQDTYAFGDLVSLKPGDSTDTVLLGNARVSSSSSETYPFSTSAISSSMSYYGLYVARSYTNLGGPVALGWHADTNKGSSNWGGGFLLYPHGPDGGLYLSPVWAHEPQTSPYSVRGTLPGLWVPCHYSGILSQYQTFEGQGELAGKTFMARIHGTNTCVLEISDTWDR